jgi:hypothetical protein
VAKARPKTGEPRQTNQPFYIDRLPPSVWDEIVRLYNGQGKTWEEIEALSALPTDKGGFVEWENLPTPVLELFPNMRIPRSNLHRWYDVRKRQVQREVLIRSEQARTIAESFAKSELVNGDEAVINAARDTLMGVLAEDGSEAGRLNATKGLIKLGELMQKAKTNSIRERKVSVDEQTLQLKLDEIKRRTEKLIGELEPKPGEAAQTISREDVLRQVKDIYGVA